MGSNKEGFVKEMALTQGFETGKGGAWQRAMSAELTASMQAPKVSRYCPWEGGSGRKCRALNSFAPVWGRDPGIPLLWLLILTVLPPLYELDGGISLPSRNEH